MIRTAQAAATAALCMAMLAHAHSAAQPVLPAQGDLQAAFAPWDDIEALITEKLHDARREILVQAYLLTNKKIAIALIAARQRGVRVQVLVDAEQAKSKALSEIQVLSAAGIPVWLETRYQNAHNKIIIIDVTSPDATVITGSFNFTWTAQHKNAENMLIVRKNPALAARYAENWERHRRDATAYNQ